MAPPSQQPPDVELCRSEIPKPRPLRIVKRGQTVTGCPSPRAFIDGRRDNSGCLDEDMGSPPAGADRPLTVRKTRKARGTVLNRSLDEGPGDQSPRSAILDLIERNSPWRARNNDPDSTPKANIDTTIPGDQARPVSRSKKFFLKAIPGRNYSGSLAQKTIRRISSNVSKRIKRTTRAEKDSSSFYGADENLTLSAMSCSNREDIAEIGTNSALSFQTAGKMLPLPTLDSLYMPGFRGTFILCPQINVTPELTVIDTNACSVWVALEVTGALRRADGQEEYGNGADRYPSHSSTQPSDLKCYGLLHSMRLDLLPGRDCMISEIFGNLRELKTLGAKETYLVLVKIRLGSINPPQENSRDTTVPDDLIAGLESDLSNITAPFLMVRVTYKHSCFLDRTPSPPRETGMSIFSTKMQSEATAVIQRTNLQSQWSPRVSHRVNGPANVNPLIKLIETHFPVEKARSALRKLANDRVQIPPARRPRKSDELDGSCEGTLRSHHISSLTARLDSIATTRITLCPIGMDGATANADEGFQDGTEQDSDPAHKIWAEIRHTSRGGHDRSSTHNSSHTEAPEDSAIRTSIGVAVEDERNRIKETALKNKRSLGADSLRSIAPSITSTEAKPARPGPGLGLSMTSRWGWGGAWW